MCACALCMGFRLCSDRRKNNVSKMEPPMKPNDLDCCGSGCNPCIFDVYQEQLKHYESNKKQAISHKKNCISQTCYTEFRLVERKLHSKSTVLCTFRCEDNRDDGVLSYNAGQHFLLRGENGKFTRAYTPIPPQPDPYSFCTLIKLYDNGIMSNYLKRLAINSKTLWRGPYGDYVLNFSYKYILGLVQGTGVAPIYSIFSAIIENETCETFLQLFCCYRDSKDFLLHNELYTLSSNWNFSYQIFFSCDDEPTGIKYNEIVHCRRLCCSDVDGYFLGKDVSKLQVLICGSKDFNSYWLDIIKNYNVGEKNICVF